MMHVPKSLTAVVHVRFKESETQEVDASEIEMMSKILDQASEMPPDLQEILAKFAEYLGTLGKKG